MAARAHHFTIQAYLINKSSFNFSFLKKSLTGSGAYAPQEDIDLKLIIILLNIRPQQYIYENNDQFEMDVFLQSIPTSNQFSFFQKAKFNPAFKGAFTIYDQGVGGILVPP